MNNKVLHIEETEEAVLLTLSRPEKRNALNKILRIELYNALENFEDQKKVIIISGTGVAFCAGLDLNDNLDMHALDEFWSIVQQIRLSKSIIVGAINGIAIGGGLIIANVCDFAIGAHESRYGMPKMDTARFPSLQSPLSKLKEGELGQPWKDITGQLIEPKEAFRMELINHVAQRGALLQDSFYFSKKFCEHNISDLIKAKKKANINLHKEYTSRESLALGGRGARDFRNWL